MRLISEENGDENVSHPGKLLWNGPLIVGRNIVGLNRSRCAYVLNSAFQLYAWYWCDYAHAALRSTKVHTAEEPFVFLNVKFSFPINLEEQILIWHAYTLLLVPGY